MTQRKKKESPKTPPAHDCLGICPLTFLLKELSNEKKKKMVAFTILRQATRASPARLVAGMRVSLVSSASSSLARPVVSKMASNVMNVGTRGFSSSARRFGSGTSEFLAVCFPSSLPPSESVVGFTRVDSCVLCIADVSLSQKLQEELKYEQDAAAEAGDATPEFLKTFLEQGIWSVRVFPFFRLGCDDL